MKQLFFRFTSLLLCGAVLTGECIASAEETQTGSVTVSVYDDDTGSLIDANIYFNITESTEELLSSIGHGFGVDGGQWHTSNENPFTLTDIEIKSGWFQMIEIITQNNDDYYYTINYDKSDTKFYLSESPEQDLSVYLTKTEKERFLVYRGTYGEEQYSLFEYFYPSSSSATVDRHKKVFYQGDINEKLTYGDILTTDSIISTTRDHSYYTYRIKDEPVFTKIGNCADLFDAQTLTISGIKYYDYASDAGFVEAYPEYAYTDYYAFVLTDETGTNYSYTVDYYDTSSAIKLDKAKLGDTLLFAIHDGQAVLPLTEPLHIPDIMGDVNEDREFTVLDIVLFQKWLLGVTDTSLPDWKAADFNEDEKLDIFDFCLMKRALMTETKKPHYTMTVTTNYGGTGVMGQELGSGSFTETFTVSEGDLFYETSDGHWLKNANNIFEYENKIMSVEDFNADGVTFTYADYDDEMESTVSYGDASQINSTFYIYDGTNYDYKISFSDYIDMQ